METRMLVALGHSTPQTGGSAASFRMNFEARQDHGTRASQRMVVELHRVLPGSAAPICSARTGRAGRIIAVRESGTRVRTAQVWDDVSRWLPRRNMRWTMEVVTRTGAATAMRGELGDRLAGKYMTFLLDGEHYGLEILKVREIVGVTEIARLPRVQAFVRGVMNLRGKVVPVIDLRVRFGLDRRETTDQTVIIVLQCQVGARPLTVGVLVDQVLEVLGVGAEDVEPPPWLGAATTANEFILGVGKQGKQVVFLLDVARILPGGGAPLSAGATPVQADP